MGTKTTTVDANISFLVSDQKRFDQLWRLFYSIVNSRVTDPKARGTRFVYKSYPDQVIKDTSTVEQLIPEYPIIVVNDPDLSDEPITADTKTTEYINEQVIDIYSERTDTMSNLAQTIDYQLTKSDAINMFEEAGVFRVRLTDTDYDHEQHSGVKVHVKSLTYSYDFPEER